MAGNYASQERAVDTPGKRWWQALMAMAMSEAEGALGKMFEQTRRQWARMFATFSPEDLSGIRQQSSRYDWGCVFRRMPTSESPTVSAAPHMEAVTAIVGWGGGGGLWGRRPPGW